VRAGVHGPAAGVRRLPDRRDRGRGAGRRRPGGLSERRGDRFGSLRWRATADGAILLEGASAWLDCSIEREIRVGDHDLILLRVHALDADPDVPPLVFHGSRYRRLSA
jgi:flavin reductase (DIM6/NTAB) family NADH-FMN oxidoreductase RutF